MVELALRLVFSLAVVIGLLLVTVKVGGRKFRPRNGALVRVVHRQALSRGTAVAVVQVGSRVLVLGTTEHQVNVLAELEEGELGEPAAAAAMPTARHRRFAETAGLDDQDGLDELDELDDLSELDDWGGQDDPHGVEPVRAASNQRALPASGPLAGSVLSAETWRQAMAVATGRAS